MRVDMRADVCIGMRVGMRAGMRAGTHVGMHVQTRSETRVDMHVGTCVDMHVDLCVDMPAYSIHFCEHVCVNMHACTHVYKHLPAWACLGHFWRPDVWPKTAHRAPLSEKFLAPRGRSGRGGLSLCPAHTPICFRLPLSSPAFVSRFRLPLSSP